VLSPRREQRSVLTRQRYIPPPRGHSLPPQQHHSVRCDAWLLPAARGRRVAIMATSTHGDGIVRPPRQ
jgi:hypothetical protein